MTTVALIALTLPARDRPYTSQSDVWRQIVTYKITVRIKILIMAAMTFIDIYDIYITFFFNLAN